ncbi:MAG: aminopeptidase P family protein [Bacteroidales bacterium]|nr:aminopeptidase P family protein [Bacteroidales bacterium]MCB8998746.1 aminopeptidase P family protein [Bacteroidales bacterium]
MFDKAVYTNRRDALRKKCKGGLILLPGNNESAMNYAGNTYPFRQDSTFLYFFGIDQPGLTAIIDLDSGEEVIYGNEMDIDDIIWMGNQSLISENAAKAGVTVTKPLSDLYSDVKGFRKQKRDIKILPPYRGDNEVFLSVLLGVPLAEIRSFISEELIRAAVAVREIKEKGEIEEMEFAIDVAYRMHTTMMKMAQPGIWEREIVGQMEGIAIANGGMVSFPIILSMDGQTLHNHFHGNQLKEGRIVVSDAGCESPLHYASDITRSVPVGGRFSQRQKEIYEIVLAANMKTIESVKPGMFNRDLHLMAARTITDGLKELGLMKGNTEEAVQKGAHAMFFPHGLGHMLGLDVHDMESYGENYVGYDETIKRSDQFGTAYLRLGKKLKPGFVFTIEPGLYFIPALIDLWKKEHKFDEFINYNKVETYKDFGGIRIEDDILVTEDGGRVLGKAIPKTIAEVEDMMR